MKIKDARYTFKHSEFDDVSHLAKDLIRKLLEKNVKRRLTTEKALKHPWFLSQGQL
jgi:serine/threonine protein kinase